MSNLSQIFPDFASARTREICGIEQGHQSDGVHFLGHPQIDPGLDRFWKRLVAMASDDDHVRASHVAGGHLAQARNAEASEIPHPIRELAIVTQLVGDVVVGPSRVLAGYEILVCNHYA